MKFKQFTEVKGNREFPVVINLDRVSHFHSEGENRQRVMLFTDEGIILVKENFDDLSRRLQQL